MRKNYLISDERVHKMSNLKRWILFIAIIFIANSILNYIESIQNMQLFNNIYYIRQLFLFLRVTLAGVLIHDIVPKFKNAVISIYSFIGIYLFYVYNLSINSVAIIKYGLFIIFIVYVFFIRIKVVGIYDNQIKKWMSQYNLWNNLE